MADRYEDITEMVDDSELADPGEYLATMSTGLVSGVLGLMGFMTACVIGLIAGNPATMILIRAMVAMLVCAGVGRVLGLAGEVCVREFVTRYKSERPRPVKPKELVDFDREKQQHDAVIDSMKKAA